MLHFFLSDCIVPFDKDPIGQAVDTVYSIVNSTEESSLATNVRAAVTVLEKAFDDYR